MRKSIISLALLLATIATGANGQTSNVSRDELNKVLKSSMPTHIQVGRPAVDTVIVDARKRIVTIQCNETTSYLPFTNEYVANLKENFKTALGSDFEKYKIEITANGYKAEDLVLGAKRKNIAPKEKFPFVVEADKFTVAPTEGLEGANIAVWQSHGWYFEKKLNRWEWQRARIMQTVEDLYTQSYVVPFLMPMLENAGAYVLCPRERDMTDIEIIIDNDGELATGTYSENNHNLWSNVNPGFAHIFKNYTDIEGNKNPFTLGTARKAAANSGATASWNANVPVARNYAVYVSYKSFPNSSTKAVYTVNAADGAHKVTVNQKMGGSTWIYLGTFPLAKGQSAKPIVTLTAEGGKKNEVVSADAVKIGGGMGNIARAAQVIDQNGDTVTEYIASGYPRFTEGARYWLQWAGMPDSVYTPYNGKNDYTDDYTSRALWVNYMAGGSSMLPKREGLNIPIDLSFAFHSDAGTTYNDSIIGSLGIYSTNDNKTTGNGSSRLSNRDLTDMVITEIVNDIRANYEPNWTRRGLWDKKYYEARVPEVPAMLLELLSHQNFADMKYGLDPTFRFTVSRAIYKAMGRFIAARDNRQFVVQPLPIKNFAITRNASKQYKLSWAATPDKLEETAMPDYYNVLMRVDNGAFKVVATVDNPEYTFTAPDDHIYSFQIVAGNKGGVSFPSETLALCELNNSKAPVTIVNGFTRVSGPDTFDAGNIAGFYDMRDHGVPYVYDASFIGSQFEFRRQIPWMDDDAAGFGASRANYENKIVAGNTFDYVYLHGQAIRNAGYSFISTSVGAFVESDAASTPGAIDLILGKQKETKVGTGLYGTKYKAFPAELQARIKAHVEKGGNIFVSGSYVATDLWDNPYSDKETLEADKKFATEVLGYNWRVGQASVTGEAYETVSPFKQFKTGRFDFYNELNADSYAVESPDSFFASKKEGATIMRYSENNLVAGVATKTPAYSTVIIGFPFESIKAESGRDLLMKQILEFFNK